MSDDDEVERGAEDAYLTGVDYMGEPLLECENCKAQYLSSAKTCPICGGK